MYDKRLIVEKIIKNVSIIIKRRNEKPKQNLRTEIAKMNGSMHKYSLPANLHSVLITISIRFIYP